MRKGFLRTWLGDGVLLALAFSACDGSDEGGLPASSNMQIQAPATDSDKGKAKITVVLNEAPAVETITSSTGRIASHAPVTVAAYVGDPDGDPLAFAWTCDCPGTFDHTDRSRVTFVAGELAFDVSCTFSVEVSDGHGGVAQGALTLSSHIPVINVAPQMGVSYQSAGHSISGGQVLLHASAEDPEGEPVAWTWKADGGSLVEQTDAGSASEMRWRAPDGPSGKYTITATATDPRGAAASHAFFVTVSP